MGHTHATLSVVTDPSGDPICRLLFLTGPVFCFLTLISPHLAWMRTTSLMAPFSNLYPPEREQPTQDEPQAVSSSRSHRLTQGLSVPFSWVPGLCIQHYACFLWVLRMTPRLLPEALMGSQAQRFTCVIPALGKQEAGGSGVVQLEQQNPVLAKLHWSFRLEGEVNFAEVSLPSDLSSYPTVLSSCISASGHVPRGLQDSCVLHSLPNTEIDRSCTPSSGVQALLGGLVGLTPPHSFSSQHRVDSQRPSPLTQLPRLEETGICLFLILCS